jgi:hypothetical protein
MEHTIKADQDALQILTVLYRECGTMEPSNGIYAADVLFDARQYLADRQRYERIKNQTAPEVI